MLHKFFEPGYWFAPKKFGYGSGWPIAWQGWALLLSYSLVLLGIGLLMEALGEFWIFIGVAIMIIITFPFLLLVKRRTKGGWKMRP